jgi:DNA-binding NarL/FixJ family response regulator
MDLRVYSTSRSLQNHLNQVIETPFDFQSHLADSGRELAKVNLLHISPVELPGLDWLERIVKNTDKIVGVCSDNPNVVEMLECVEAGAQAYCNSYMQAANYQQLLRLLSNGQSWFPPSMLSQVFTLAHQKLKGKDTDALLQALTLREKEVAIAVSQGLSNREISERFEISERTVKTHLTNIFVKLELKDRVALVIYLR